MQRENKTIYIIPGFGESIKDSGYSELCDFLKSKNYNVTFYQPIWERSTMTRWLRDFDKVLMKDGLKDPIVLGFSLGANIAAIASQQHVFSKLVLCSLSPFFRDDITKFPPLAEKILGKKRMSDFKKYTFPQNVVTPAVFIFGEEELNIEPKIDKKYFDLWKGKKDFIVVLKTGHDISDPQYLTEIKKVCCN